MKKNTLILVVLFSLSAFEPMAQVATQNLDSLYTVWQDPTKPDTVRVIAYKDYIWNGFLFTKPDSAIVMAENLYNYAKKYNYPEATGLAHNIVGSAKYLQGENSLALKYYEMSLAIYELLGNKTAIASRLNNIGSVYTAEDNFNLALEYYGRSIAMHEEIGNKKDIAIGLNNIGNIYNQQSNYSRSLECFEKSFAIWDELGDKLGMAKNTSDIGGIYFAQGNYPLSLEYYEKALAVYEEAGNKSGTASSLNNIGNIFYLNQSNSSRAQEYYEKGQAIYEELGDKMGIASSLNNIGNIYFSQEQNSKALEYYEKALALQEELGNKKGIGNNLNNIGVIYEELVNYPRAHEYFKKSVAIYEEIGYKRGIASGLCNIGIIFRNQGNAKLGIEYCQKGLSMAEEVGALEYQKQALQCLYDNYKAMGKGLEALMYLEKLRMVEDSLNAQETTKKLEQMEFAKVRLQDSLAKAEEARLIQEAHYTEVRKKNKVRNVFMGSSLFLLLIAGGFYSRWRYMRKSRDTISKEKDRSEILLLNILPAEIAAELKEKGRAEARDFDMVSILFTDFKEFTRASEKLSAQELVSEINACFEAFDAICERYQIEKIKTIGDAYMAAGGLPVPSDDSVENTVRAALEMQAFISQRKAENEAAGHPAFEMRVGVHTGPVVAGIVGVKKFQYDIWGDTVNTAARMESSGEVGKVNISEVTYELVKDQFECTYRGEVEAKGKGKLGMYFVNEHTIS